MPIAHETGQPSDRPLCQAGQRPKVLPIFRFERELIARLIEVGNAGVARELGISRVSTWQRFQRMADRFDYYGFNGNALRLLVSAGHPRNRRTRRFTGITPKQITELCRVLADTDLHPKDEWA